MPRYARRNLHSSIVASIWLLTVGLLLLQPTSLIAQSGTLVKPDDVVTPLDEEADDIAQKEVIPFEFKLDERIESFAEEVNEAQQFAHSLYLPNMHMGTMVETSATTPAWRVVLNETFEGSFPTTGWSVVDYNGPSVGTPIASGATLKWDDTSTRAYQGYWSAQPNDYSRYANNTDTWMRYGPMNTTGATKVRLTFYYWMDTEAHYDIFAWSVSCGGDSAYRIGHQRSGQVRQWIKVSYEVPDCANKPQFYLKFEFKSDYSNPNVNVPTGVWVDNILVEKYQ